MVDVLLEFQVSIFINISPTYKVIANPPSLSVLSPCYPSHQSSLPKECQFGSANNAGNYGCMLDCKWACCHCRILARISTRHATSPSSKYHRFTDSFKLFFFPFYHYYSYPKEKPESLSIFVLFWFPRLQFITSFSSNHNRINGLCSHAAVKPTSQTELHAIGLLCSSFRMASMK